MAPIKFEEQLKDKLEKRTLSPSSEGWSQLSERLDAHEKKSKNPLFWWLSIAAGLIIMIAVSVQFFNNNDAQEVMPQVAEEPVKEELEDKNESLNNTESIELVIEDETLKDEKGNVPITKESQIIDYKKVTNKKSEPKTQLTENEDSAIKTNTQKAEDILKEDVSIITDKSMMKEALVTALKDSKVEETSVTDREIDSLLKVASKELFKNKLQKETSKTVDANALLLSVEEDMGQSFRSKVFNALKESYKTVKTKVAERNN